MLNISHLINTGCDCCMETHCNVYPVIPNQYHDMCSRTCLDRNVLLIKRDAVSTEIADMLRAQWLYSANENIDSLSKPSGTIQDIYVQCVTYVGPVDKDIYLKSRSLPTVFVTLVTKGTEMMLYLKEFYCVLFYCRITPLAIEIMYPCAAIKLFYNPQM